MEVAGDCLMEIGQQIYNASSPLYDGFRTPALIRFVSGEVRGGGGQRGAWPARGVHTCARVHTHALPPTHSPTPRSSTWRPRAAAPAWTSTWRTTSPSPLASPTPSSRPSSTCSGVSAAAAGAAARGAHECARAALGGGRASRARWAAAACRPPTTTPNTHKPLLEERCQARLHWGKAGWPAHARCFDGAVEYGSDWCQFGCAVREPVQPILSIHE